YNGGYRANNTNFTTLYRKTSLYADSVLERVKILKQKFELFRNKNFSSIHNNLIAEARAQYYEDLEQARIEYLEAIYNVAESTLDDIFLTKITPINIQQLLFYFKKPLLKHVILT
ncbi:MAG: hypothetical protein LBF97_01570, partial [Elusimicrobiota bacterium]|nr:hypothetical protein [Elusimicrobiota bacterium]